MSPNMIWVTQWRDKMIEKVPAIGVGEKVSVKIYLTKALKDRYVLKADYRAYGEVVEVKRVNLVLMESIESMLPGKRWLVRRSRVRRDKD